MLESVSLIFHFLRVWELAAPSVKKDKLAEGIGIVSWYSMFSSYVLMVTYAELYAFPKDQLAWCDGS